MKTHRPMFVSMLMVLSGITHAQDNATPAPATADAPAPAAAPAQTEMQKWIATTDAQWQAVFKRDVSDVHLTELEKLKQQYVASLEAAVTKASGAGDLDGAVALRNEEKRFAGTNVFPEQDDAADAASVKQIRAAIRAQIARLEKENAARAKSLHAKYDQVLAQTQTQLTQRQRLEDALLVKAKREEVAAAWITPAVATVAEKINPPATAPAAGVQKPATLVKKVPFGTKPGSGMAQVKAEDAPLVPLRVGEIVNMTQPSGGANCVWVSFPESLQGFQFTKSKKISVPLSFRVQSDGLVYLACTSDFGRFYSGGAWQKEVIGEDELLKHGWKKQDDLILRDSDEVPGHHVWWVYARECKAGEKFAYRTGKYAPPILLVK